MKNFFIAFVALLFIFSSCTKQESSVPNKEKGSAMSSISENIVGKVQNELLKKFGEAEKFRIDRGVKQAAMFWMGGDGNPEDFEKFCSEYFIGDSVELETVFQRISKNIEAINGHLHEVSLVLQWQVALDLGEIHPIDRLFASYDPFAHVKDDFFRNKLAFVILLNFPYYSLEEKSTLGEKWTRKQWAYARVGDLFTSRVPAELEQKRTEAMANADAYISDYNIYVGYLKDNSGKTFFPKDMKLITHWNLRDEIKSQYGNKDGIEAQRIIYEVMKRIITQEIPSEVINSDKYTWNPYQNKLFKDDKEIASKPEPDTRYQHLLDNFLACRAIDAYNPYYPTYIDRTFNQDMELSQKYIEDLFVKFISSPQVKDVAALISKRLGRKLEPFDVWYDGFKSRSSISQEELNSKTKGKYPTPAAFAADMPVILKKLGFSPADAAYISSKIEVDPSRGAGHATGAEMKSAVSRLRTRVGKDGMDYKGYNIAVHEFGHNVEQTITLQDVDYFMMKGVPNTAFTEAWAFVFQKRDLELLGMKENNPDKEFLDALDNFWSTYEIMGVSLVDMRVWKWLYEHPNATAADLKKAVIQIATEVWNQYYGPVFGIMDQPILAIYSHMIDYPLYLSAYPVGHIIEFQMESYIKGKNLATEMKRMLVQGRLIPQLWMKGAVGSELSIQPTLDATKTALDKMK